ncbi:hypothetical protein SPRG_08028 [Saprolegnia parasitica CBS 223.65]|uniref:PX domain-containing protein n=1 Tax=Saprolegnia parasitica (strain CBS 223.65) TaxID=695850 RepID=A0A067C786_SAPPC|nr:hypothetical protein SPRG_08028 [Saprolegnia parasitica CBS 223.65]KDO26624.1 hypothetical protein SPRG_08028 [Saprolegnia parasitica CBS 223.65]|eukprot:XP_012202764.1 hypothetical protein SPRG_08028 [Saprolegnia parasitica CBS 223.65]
MGVATRTLLSATVVERRSLPSRGYQYKLHIVSDQGELSVWHKYKTFQNLATTLTIQLLHDGITEIPHGFDLPRDDTTVDLPLLNAFLVAAVETDLDWGIRIDASTVVYKPKHRPSSSSSFSFVDRKASMAHHDDATQRVLVEARIIDARVVRVAHPETMNEYDVVQYCLALETRAHGPMRIWRRYSTFSSLATSLQRQCPRMRHELDVPEADLRSSQLSASNIQSRIEVLNQFLLVACKTSSLEWGIRIDADTCVYKRKVVDEPRIGVVLYEEPTKSCCVAETVSLISAKVAGFRVGARKDAAGHASVKYNLQMDCLSNLGGICTYSIWRRFATFEELAKSVAGLAPHIPSLRASDDEHHDKALVQRRIDALNHLFDVLSACDELEWGIRVDADTTVYKHRVV